MYELMGNVYRKLLGYICWLNLYRFEITDVINDSKYTHVFVCAMRNDHRNKFNGKFSCWNDECIIFFFFLHLFLHMHLYKCANKIYVMMKMGGNLKNCRAWRTFPPLSFATRNTRARTEKKTQASIHMYGY